MRLAQVLGLVCAGSATPGLSEYQPRRIEADDPHRMNWCSASWIHAGSRHCRAGSCSRRRLERSIDTIGYWLVAADGGTFSEGDAQFLSPAASMHFNAPVVDTAPTGAAGDSNETGRRSSTRHLHDPLKEFSEHP